MYYVVYQVTCKVNGKSYIGKHQTENLDDGYMGSGKLLRRAIKKHGVENFEKTYLYFCNTEEEMNLREAELVTEEWCASDDNYNLCPGGQGGWGYVNQNGMGLNDAKRLLGSKKVWKMHRDRHNERMRSDPEYRKVISEKIAAANRRRTGSKHSEETKRKMSESHRKRRSSMHH